MMFRRHKIRPSPSAADMERELTKGAFAASQVNSRALVLVDQLLLVARRLDEVLREEQQASDLDVDAKQKQGT